MKPKYIIGIIVVVSAFVYLIWSSIGGSFQFSITPTELLADKAKFSQKSVKISGFVSNLSVNGTSYSFFIKDEKTGIPVHYKGMVPNSFRETSEVIAVGTFEEQMPVFEAKQLISKCASKYEGPPTQGSPTRGGS